MNESFNPEVFLNSQIIKVCRDLGITKEDLRSGHYGGIEKLTQLITINPKFRSAINKESQRTGHSEVQLAMTVVKEMIQRFEQSV